MLPVSLLFSPRPIGSVLIANRGEIALRVMRTCARLGIRTIAVYSDADAQAPHVKAADEAIRIGPPPARASYLDIDAILAAAKQAGADAIHPGYGFLSENANFVKRCEAAGLIFVGPSAKAVEQMGSKIESKRIAEAAGVPTVPGYHGNDQSEATLAREASRIGFPVLIKASAGGGGRGMRRVDAAADFKSALAAAKAEAEAAFGDGSVLLEKFILNPRHLEVQLAGDRTGNLVHLFERDCSVQRNNQKLLEEAPAPNLPGDVRAKLFYAALKLGHTIGYNSAGTVEFIMDRDSDAPYFLEMNTRLQVEHPVTEFITGVDLVEWQLLAAAGEKLPLTQEQIRARGHAIEARITAERADLGFQPATGTLSAVDAPHGVRFDSGVEAGSQVSLYYDSMLAKLIAHGTDRAAALARLTKGLSELTLLGVPDHPAVPARCIASSAVCRRQGNHALHRDGVPRRLEAEHGGAAQPARRGLRGLGRARRRGAGRAMDQSLGSPQRHRASRPRCGRPRRRCISPTNTARPTPKSWSAARASWSNWRVHRSASAGPAVDGDAITLASPSGHPFIARRDGNAVSITREGLSLTATIRLRIEMPREQGHLEKSGNVIEAPLHGVVSQLHVALGDAVEKGAPVLQMEAMKLIHTLRAQVPGRVGQIRCNVGDTVPAGAILIEITPNEVEERS